METSSRGVSVTRGRSLKNFLKGMETLLIGDVAESCPALKNFLKGMETENQPARYLGFDAPSKTSLKGWKLFRISSPLR